MNLHILVLTTLRDRGGRMNFTDLLNHLPIHTEGGKIYAVLRELNQIGFITGDFRSGSTVCLTPAGTKFLFEQDQQDGGQCRDTESGQKSSKAHARFKVFLNGLKNFSVQIIIATIAGILSTIALILIGLS